MQHNIKSLSGFTIGATDGEIGKVKDFYFDDQTWTVRYLVVKTGNWLSDRKVLLSPVALQQLDWKNKVFSVNLNKQQVQDSPDIDTEKTVSRVHEIELYNHYAWPYYGVAGAGFYGGMGMSGMVDSRIPFEEAIAEQHMHNEGGNTHLRGTEEIQGYHIHAIDGKIGEVVDFILNTETWTIDYLVVDTGNWFPGKKVILSPEWIKQVKWEDTAIEVDVPVDAVKHSPEYNAEVPLQERYKEKLHHYYGKSTKP